MDDTTQWPVQGMVVVKAAERKARPAHKEDGLNCPRCSSTNTKFCYYNNYSLTQPRYLCKACRRYWTQGGCLRNVPVGGGSRKYRRPSSRSTTTSSTNQNPKIQYSSHYNNNNNNNNNNNSSIEMSEYMGLPFDSRNPNYFTNSSLPVMELFKTGNMGIYDSSGFHDYKTSLGFPAEGYNGNDNNLSRNINSPIGDTKQLQVSNVDHRFDHEIQAEPNNGGFWNGMIAGGSSW